MDKAHGKVYGELLLLCNYCPYKVTAEDLGMEDKRVSRSWDLPGTVCPTTLPIPTFLQKGLLLSSSLPNLMDVPLLPVLS